MKIYSLFIFFLISGVSLATEPSPYAGEEQRGLKSLSEQEIASLRRGDGMGFAKLAELNHYPGPKHVLDMSTDLNLSSAQLEETQRLYADMRSNAIALGEALLSAESGLNKKFEEASITAQSLESGVLEIGELRARLRFVHLEAHLRQAQILTDDQISKYDEARGYQGEAQNHSHHPGTHD